MSAEHGCTRKSILVDAHPCASEIGNLLEVLDTDLIAMELDGWAMRYDVFLI